MMDAAAPFLHHHIFSSRNRKRHRSKGPRFSFGATRIPPAAFFRIWLISSNFLRPRIVAAAADASCSSTNVWAVGSNSHGQFGGGEELLYTTSTSPILVGSLDETGGGLLVDVATGNAHSAIAKTDGTAWTTGYNGNGQLGHGCKNMTTTTRDEQLRGFCYKESRSNFTRVEGLADVVKVASGGSNTFFITENGNVFATGRNVVGQLGLNDRINRYAPEQVGIVNVVSVAAGHRHTLFLRSDGRVFATAWNGNGRLCLGLDDNTLRDHPFEIHALPHDVVQIHAGYDHSVFLRDDGTVWTCGDNTYGQLGLGDNVDRNSPVQVESLSTFVAAIATSNFNTLFLLQNGTVLSTGSNEFGQLGGGLPMNTTMHDRNIPGLVFIEGVTAIHGSKGHHFHLLRDDDTVWGLGRNSNGELGVGDIVNRNVPMQISTLAEKVLFVRGGWEFSLFVAKGTSCTEGPSQVPTPSLTHSPSNQPSISPMPFMSPSSMPTGFHSSLPSLMPTSEVPSSAPSFQRSVAPSLNPTDQSSPNPSTLRTHSPSHDPSSAPTSLPPNSEAPSELSSNQPTVEPTASPADSPTNSAFTSGSIFARSISSVVYSGTCLMGVAVLCL